MLLTAKVTISYHKCSLQVPFFEQVSPFQLHVHVYTLRAFTWASYNINLYFTSKHIEHVKNNKRIRIS